MKTPRRFVFLLSLLTTAIVAYFYGEEILRRLLLYLSNASWAREFVTQFPPARLVAKRFVAGETIAEAIHATQELNEKGMTVTLDFLGESVNDADEALVARDEILALLDAIADSGVTANVSLKLSQLGLKLDPELAYKNLHRLLAHAKRHNNKIRIDMEESEVLDTTLDIYRKLRFHDGFDNVGVVIQTYLYRSEADIRQLINEGAWVRLVKGAYLEPEEIAYPEKPDTDASFVYLTGLLLSEEARENGVYAGIATHDQNMIQATIDYAWQHKVPPTAYEFQMLYGIRRELQQSLVDQGYQMRIYVPYGTAWYPYFMRRLAERPANLWFFVSNLLR